MLSLDDVKNSLVTTKTCAEGSCSSRVKSYFEKQEFEAQKKVKNKRLKFRFEWKIAKKNSQKMGACAKEEKHFFSDNQKMRKKSSSSWSESSLKKISQL